MKRSIFFGVLGLATGVASSHGQGFLLFSSYAANGGAGALTSFLDPVNWLGFPFRQDFIMPSEQFQIQLTVLRSAVPSRLYTGPNATAAYDNSGYAVGGAGLGYFDGGVAVIPGYIGGPITFEVVAFNGSSYDDSILKGRSGSFTMDSIAGPDQPVTVFGDNGQPMPNFYIAIIPEPATLALAGLGGLVSLLMFRRKQS